MAQIMGYKHLEMPIVKIDDREYAVGTEEQADNAAREAIEGSLSSFEPYFISQHSTIQDYEIINAIKKEGTKATRKIITDIDAFVDNALSLSNRGEFLSPVNGTEETLASIDDDVAQEIATVLGIPEDKWKDTFVYQVQ
jgi:hypothetical protein